MLERNIPSIQNKQTIQSDSNVNINKINVLKDVVEMETKSEVPFIKN